MPSFWDSLPKPFFCLAPLADVTDPPFRRVIASLGMPDVMWTEFVSADGLFKGGYDALVRHLAHTEAERPLIAQFFSRDPELMARATMLAIDLGFDGVDVNMGCPDQNVCKQGCGAAIIKEPALAQGIVRAMKAASEASMRPIPVSVKTRIGYSENEIETWLPALLETQPAAITLHARTRKEMSKVPAHWDVVKQAVEIRDEMQKNDRGKEVMTQTLIIGNGDAVSIEDAKAKADQSGCDGVMLGRAIFGNPWLFVNLANRTDAVRPARTERLRVLMEHIALFDEFSRGRSSFAVMKKHFKSYITGSDGSKELVIQLMETKTAGEAIRTIEAYIKTTPGSKLKKSALC